MLLQPDAEQEVELSTEANSNGEAGSADLLVIGGGINGCGIAADAAGRGLRVLLCEQADLGGATSSASSKLIHGGLRYLEQGAFGMVRQALAEREVLLQSAPHIIWPLRLRLPHRRGLRPRWLIACGLWLYDHLSRRNSLPSSRSWTATAEDRLREPAARGFVYSDCWVDDARLVICNALQARDHGATILPRTRCSALTPVGGGWLARLEQACGTVLQVQARAVVNASGPWAAQTRDLAGPRGGATLRLVKGSHLVVPRLHQHDDAYLLQHGDRRVIFVLPFGQQFSLIGTTEEAFEGDALQAQPSADEVEYLLEAVSEQFALNLKPEDIVHRFSGVRPLLEREGEDNRRLSRDYSLSLETTPAPMLQVWGGKLTTYRKLAESALQQLQPLFPQMGPAWTARARLPGAFDGGHDALVASWLQRYPWAPEAMLQRWARSYGALAEQILTGCQDLADLGQHFGSGFYRRELDYLCRNEWAQQLDDVLWRRTKLGLHLDATQQAAVAQALTQKQAEAGRDSALPV